MVVHDPGSSSLSDSFSDSGSITYSKAGFERPPISNLMSKPLVLASMLVTISFHILCTTARGPLKGRLSVWFSREREQP